MGDDTRSVAQGSQLVNEPPERPLGLGTHPAKPRRMAHAITDPGLWLLSVRSLERDLARLPPGVLRPGPREYQLELALRVMGLAPLARGLESPERGAGW